MTVGTIKMTARQFLQLGEDPPGLRLELVDGEVTVSPSPQPLHSFVDRQLTLIVGAHIRDNDLGELFGDVDTLLSDFDVRRPDLLYFAKDRLHLVGEKAIEGPPDLCVEIISPSSTTIDRKQKFKQYEKAGVAHYWIVDPEAKTIEGYKMVGKKYQATGGGKGTDVVRLPPFEKLQIKLAELWGRWGSRPRRGR
jgi:Uma2 family endonuclease